MLLSNKVKKFSLSRPIYCPLEQCFLHLVFHFFFEGTEGKIVAEEQRLSVGADHTKTNKLMSDLKLKYVEVKSPQSQVRRDTFSIHVFSDQRVQQK